MMEYETATKENLVQCLLGIEITLERVARIAAGNCTDQNYSKAAICNMVVEP
jgi:hypothetical protein